MSCSTADNFKNVQSFACNFISFESKVISKALGVNSGQNDNLLLQSDVKKIPYMLLLLACFLRVLHIPPSLAYQYEGGDYCYYFLP